MIVGAGMSFFRNTILTMSWWPSVMPKQVNGLRKIGWGRPQARLDPEEKMFTTAQYTARVIELRDELRDLIKTLPPAQRAEVWKLVNKLVQFERLDAER